MQPDDAAVQLNPSLEYAVTDDGCIILDMDAGEYISLNRIAARIFQCLLEGRTTNGVIGALQQEYDAEEERLRTDVKVFLDSCRTRGWIRSEPSQSR